MKKEILSYRWKHPGVFVGNTGKHSREKEEKREVKKPNLNMDDPNLCTGPLFPVVHISATFDNATQLSQLKSEGGISQKVAAASKNTHKAMYACRCSLFIMLFKLPGTRNLSTQLLVVESLWHSSHSTKGYIWVPTAAHITTSKRRPKIKKREYFPDLLLWHSETLANTYGSPSI